MVLKHYRYYNKIFVKVKKYEIYGIFVQPQFLLSPVCASRPKIYLQDWLKEKKNLTSESQGILQTDTPVSADKVLKLMVRIQPASKDVSHA